jgi:hypothetical protein
MKTGKSQNMIMSMILQIQNKNMKNIEKAKMR